MRVLGLGLFGPFIGPRRHVAGRFGVSGEYWAKGKGLRGQIRIFSQWQLSLPSDGLPRDIIV